MCLFRISFEMLCLQTIAYWDPSIAYTCSIYCVLLNLKRMCVNDIYCAIFGSVIIFMIPVYILHWGFSTQKIHYGLFLPLVFDSFLSFDPLT